MCITYRLTTKPLACWIPGLFAISLIEALSTLDIHMMVTTASYSPRRSLWSNFLASIAFLDHNLHMTQFSVFVLIAPDNTPNTSKDAEVAVLKLLKAADAPDIKVIHHGGCVWISSCLLPKWLGTTSCLARPSRTGAFWPLESGAKRFVEVTEHCRELVPWFGVSIFLSDQHLNTIFYASIFHLWTISTKSLAVIFLCIFAKPASEFIPGMTFIVIFTWDTEKRAQPIF